MRKIAEWTPGAAPQGSGITIDGHLFAMRAFMAEMLLEVGRMQHDTPEAVNEWARAFISRAQQRVDLNGSRQPESAQHHYEGARQALDALYSSIVNPRPPDNAE
jgi:hypothetical protein